MESVISRETAIDFVANKLKVMPAIKVEEALSSKDSSSKLNLLNKIMRAANREIAFQNVTVMSREKRCVPSAEEIVEAGLALSGGLCYDVNGFFNFLLTALGYTSHLLAGRYCATGFQNCHVAVAVKGLDPQVPFDESSHLVDMGCGFPTFEAVPLHRLPQSYFQAGLEYEIQMIDGQYARLNRKGDSPPAGEPSVMVGEWRKVFTYDTTPRQLDFFPPFVVHVYVKSDYFYHAIRSVRFPETDDIVLLAILGKELMIKKNDQQQTERTPIDNMLEVYTKNFPHVPRYQIERTIAYLSQLNVEQP